MGFGRIAARAMRDAARAAGGDAFPVTLVRVTTGTYDPVSRTTPTTESRVPVTAMRATSRDAYRGGEANSNIRDVMILLETDASPGDQVEHGAEVYRVERAMPAKFENVSVAVTVELS